MSTLELVIRKRTFYGVDLYWLFRKVEGTNGKPAYTLYGDILSPTGYGFKSKARAEKIARQLEEKVQA